MRPGRANANRIERETQCLKSQGHRSRRGGSQPGNLQGRRLTRGSKRVNGGSEQPGGLRYSSPAGAYRRRFSSKIRRIDSWPVKHLGDLRAKISGFNFTLPKPHSNMLKHFSIFARAARVSQGCDCRPALAPALLEATDSALSFYIPAVLPPPLFKCVCSHSLPAHDRRPRSGWGGCSAAFWPGARPPKPSASPPTLTP